MKRKSGFEHPASVRQSAQERADDDDEGEKAETICRKSELTGGLEGKQQEKTEERRQMLTGKEKRKEGEETDEKGMKGEGL